LVPASGRCLSWINHSTVYYSINTHTHLQIPPFAEWFSQFFAGHCYTPSVKTFIVCLLKFWLAELSFSVPNNYPFAYEITEPQFIGDNFHNLPVPSQTEGLMAELMHNNMDEWPASTTDLKQTHFCCLQLDNHSGNHSRHWEFRVM